VGSRYRIYATAATEAGSNYKGPVRETVSYFTAKAQAEGLTSIDDIANYVQKNIDSKEWKRVYGELYRERNAFTGVPMYRRSLDGTIDTPTGQMDKIFTGIDKMIERGVAKVGISSTRAQREIADAVRIPLIGFPRVLMNLGIKGFDHATFGAKDFIRASKITPTDEATAFRKALLLRNGVESAQTGAAVGGMGLLLGSAGMISGAYPEDASERARWQAEGKQPFSIKMTGPDGKDHWFDVSRYIGPFSFPLLLGAQMGNGELSPKATAEMVANIATQVSKNFGTDAVADFLELSAKAMKGDLEGVWDEAQKFMPNMVGMAIPGSGQLNATARMFDTEQRSTEGDGFFDSIKKGIQRKIPGLRNSLEAKTDAFGNPLAEDQLGAILPTYGGNQDTSNAIKTELARLSEAGVEAYPTGVSGNSQNYALKDADGNGIKLKSKQQGDLDNAVKTEKARQAELVMTSKTYEKATDEEKGAMLKKLYNLDSSATAAEWAEKNGIEGVKAVSDKINNTLKVEDQQALIEHRLQGDKKDQWLDDIDNAANFYTADFKNAEANETLDYDDSNLYKKTSKKYKMVAAVTNKEFGADRDLIALYENTNKTEFKDMPEGPEKDRLRAFDLARASRGVSLASSDHKEAKYGTSGSKGGKGSKGANGGKFSFASLPASLVGTGGTGSGSGYKDNAPTFSPIR